MRRYPRLKLFDKQRVRVKTPSAYGGWRSEVTTLLLGLICIGGPVSLGGMRWWGELPLLGLVAVLLLIQGIRLVWPTPQSDTRQPDVVDFVVLLFVVYTLVRWLVAPSVSFARIESLDVIAYAGVFYTCRYGMLNRPCCMLLMYILVIMGLVETAFGYYLSHYSDPTDPSNHWFPFGSGEHANVDYFPRWVGTFGSPNHFAAFLVMGIGAALSLGSFSKLSWPLRIILFYTALMLMLGLMGSGSRGAWVAMPPAVVALVVLGIRNGVMHWWALVSGAILFLAVSFFFFSLSPVVRDRVAQGEQIIDNSGQDTDANTRAREHTFFGAGPGTFTFTHRADDSAMMALGQVLTHDDYLTCIDDYGLVGFAVVMFFVAAVTLKFFQPLWVDHRWQDRVLVAAGFAAWVAMLVQSAVDDDLHIPGNALIFFALIGLAVGRIKDPRRVDLGVPMRTPWRNKLGWTLVVISVLYGLGVGLTAISISQEPDSAARTFRLSQN